MVNAVMDAIALLSSLASDLDIMLNDLRSAPSHAATATATPTATTAAATATHQQQHQLPHQQQHLHNQHQMQSRQLQAHHWQGISNNKHNNISNNNNNNNIVNNNNNNLPHPPCLIDIKLKSSRAAATTATTAAANQLQQHQQQRRRVAPKPLPRPPRRGRPSGQKEAGPAEEEDGDTDASDLANMTSPLSATAAATRITGLSPEVKKVQRLPLWNARHGGNGSTTHTHSHAHPTNASVQRRLPVQSHQQRVLTHRVHHLRSQHGMSHETAVPGGVGGGAAVSCVDNSSSKVEVIVYTTKSDKTLKQNMNAKDDTLRKRTSLIIVPQQVVDVDVDLETKVDQTKARENGNGNSTNRNSTASMDSCVSNTTSQSNQSSSGSHSGSSSTTSSGSSSGSEDAHAAYQDLQNGNAGQDHLDHHSPSPVPRCHSSSSSSSVSESTSCSSSADYSLREQLKNFANRNVEDPKILRSSAGSGVTDPTVRLLKGMSLPVGDQQSPVSPALCDSLLSPQEVPLGRRYAEVSQFKGHPKARTSEPLPAAGATPSSLEATSVDAGNNINNNHNGQQSQKSQQQASLSAISSKLNNLAQSNLNNNNTSSQPGSMTSASTHNQNLKQNQNQNQNADSRRSSSLDADGDVDDVVDAVHGGAFEDDMQALLPKCSRRSRDELSQSRTSLVSSSEGGILAEGETSSEDDEEEPVEAEDEDEGEESSRDSSDNSPPCDLGLMERLLVTHPMWFLPGIQRSGAVHLLQGKEEGTFIVRGSSQPNTMAVSVRLPQDTGPYIEHYLIQSHDNVLSLESSRFTFGSIPSLIAHYAQCCDELPVQLMLPRVLREANNRKKLSSLALLGQEFWSYASSPALLGPPTPTVAPAREQQHLLDAKSPLSLTETSGLGTATFFSDALAKPPPTGAPPIPGSSLFSPTGSGQLLGFFSQAGTPSDTTNSSLSSFTTSGGQHLQLLSPNSVDSVILTMSPVDNSGHYMPGSAAAPLAPMPLCPSLVDQQQLSTFKVAQTAPEVADQVRPQRPKPPNTLNLKPPAPPLRWSKPHSPDQNGSGNGNFTVTTTVTFSMENGGASGAAAANGNGKFVEVTTPASSNPFNALLNGQASTFQTFAKRLSPEGECKDTLSSQGSSSNDGRWPPTARKLLTTSPMTPLTPSGGGSSSSGGKSRKSRAGKESQHYKESDILESPPLQYCASALSDKISDYEDVWSHDPSDRASLLTSFRPALDSVGGVMNRRPDLLAETPSTPTPTQQTHLTPCEEETTSTATPNESSSQSLLQFSGDVPARSRAGLLLPNLAGQAPPSAMTQSMTAGGEDDGGDTTPTAEGQTLAGSRSKQGSPFYAEPADALRQAGLTSAATAILRRQHRSQGLLASQRHSEPLKAGFIGSGNGALLQPSELEKMAGSLDELKPKPKVSQQQQQQQHSQQQQPTKRARNLIDHWQLDSSWEFMAKQDQGSHAGGDYDAAAIDWQEKENSLGKKRTLTIHQIMANRLPDLNLLELVRCSTPTQTAALQPHVQGQDKVGLGCRLSSYDNVFCQNSFGGIDSAQSDDGTIFSEPWDSSQWDSFLPHDDATINSDTIHLSKCRPALSEDDTIIEELQSTKDGSTGSCNQDTLKANRNGAGHQKLSNGGNGKANSRPKVATILRNPSMRDREVLCHPRNKMSIQSSGPGDSLRAYTLQLAQDPSSTFARNIENFICCTKESREAAPQVVMRNMRQFMSGMKNYLVKHGEGKFHAELETARARLKSDEFLNLDAMLETVMHQLVVLPLREHLYGIFVDHYQRSEDIQLLAQNVRYACEREAADFGIRPTVTPPSQAALRLIANLLWRLQEAELPLDKLELFLCVISTVFDATGCPRGQQLGADDFLPVLVYVVAKCGFVGAEIEAEFMWGLLQPTLLNGEPGYYLTALCSAVQVLKTFMASEGESGSGSLDWRSSCLPACSSVLRVIIPDECNGSLQTRTLPVRPHTTTREVCRIIAHKARITNPQDYALFKLVDGEETLLTDAECPQDARLAAKGKHCMLAYKRIDAKIAWPTAQLAGH
ncbi:protein sprint isoform X3 [Drosophila biarmipes]|uniref:protein sprint isoform X3 n=1 Tax=Drosophila biarmipes TaxID=125945 RepID=UPI0021CC5527|nr:protein sprint isoform X3 [Drosophila biarmipes]